MAQVIIGQVLTAGVGQNPARQSALKAGLPETWRLETGFSGGENGDWFVWVLALELYGHLDLVCLFICLFV